jgi:phage terminase small subunit
MALTDKQRRFVDEYLIDLNATQAAIRAGYSAKTAQIIGFENLSKPIIAAALQLRMKAREARTEITQDRVLQEYAKLAFLDPRRFYDEAGTLIPVNLLPADVAAALVGVDITESYDKEGKSAITTKKIKFIDKKGALDSVARHLGMFIDKTEISGSMRVINAAEMKDDELAAIAASGSR